MHPLNLRSINHLLRKRLVRSYLVNVGVGCGINGDLCGWNCLSAYVFNCVSMKHGEPRTVWFRNFTDFLVGCKGQRGLFSSIAVNNIKPEIASSIEGGDDARTNRRQPRTATSNERIRCDVTAPLSFLRVPKRTQRAARAMTAATAVMPLSHQPTTICFCQNSRSSPR